MNALIQAYEGMRSFALSVVATARRIVSATVHAVRGLLRTTLKAATGGYGASGVVFFLLCVAGVFVYGPAAFFGLLLSYALTMAFGLAFTVLLDRVFKPHHGLRF